MRFLISSLLTMGFIAATAHAAPPGTIFTGGKIVTVDDQFTIQEAVAVEGDRIVAVGKDKDIRALAGPATKIVELHGRTMIPGLIDNHNHFIRGAEYWTNEARLDGVNTRVEALVALKAKGRSLPRGEWLMTLGGWYEDQFTGDHRDLTLAELDAVAPDRPAFIQAKYDHAYVNTAWLKAMGLPVKIKPSDVKSSNDQSHSAYDTSGTLADDAIRDASGRATGRLKGGISLVTRAGVRFPALTDERQNAGIRAAQASFNALGLTTVFDPGGTGVRDSSYDRLRAFCDNRKLTLRVFYTLGDAMNMQTPAEAHQFAEKIRATRPFQGNEWCDLIAVGEIYYAPFHWDELVHARKPSPEEKAAALEILTAAAEGGWQVQTHAVQQETIRNLLDAMETLNRVHPLRALRWSITHADRIGPDEIERARRLGVNIQLRSQRVIGNHEGVIVEHGVHAVELMPELRLVQDSGITWGLGTDGTKAAQINPFVTLWWAVKGDMLNGTPVTKQHLTREEALIAHTRSNAMMMFQENRIGAIKPGLLADFLILDQDYLTVPVDEIKTIKPVATYVGGKLVYGQP